jgi:hypothetical protein
MRDVHGRGILVAINDIVGATVLVIWGIILGPLGILRGTLYFSNIFWYIWILSPLGLLSRFVRAAIDWRLGNFDSAVFQLEFLVTRVENALTRHPKSRHIGIVLEDFYTLLVRAYLHGGHIDDAMLVVLRAKKSLDCDKLPELARLDAKTAHLVRAGLAAGRLLDGSGLATLYIKSHEAPAQPANPPQQKPTLPPPPPAARQGASARPGATGKGYAPKPSGKIIQFPTIEALHAAKTTGPSPSLPATPADPPTTPPDTDV